MIPKVGAPKVAQRKQHAIYGMRLQGLTALLPPV